MRVCLCKYNQDIDQRKRNQNGFVVEWRSVTWVSASSHRRRASSLLPKDENTSNKFEMEVIRDVDLNSWDLQGTNFTYLTQLWRTFITIYCLIYGCTLVLTTNT